MVASRTGHRRIAISHSVVAASPTNRKTSGSTTISAIATMTKMIPASVNRTVVA